MEYLLGIILSLIFKYPDKVIPLLVIGWAIWRMLNRVGKPLRIPKLPTPPIPVTPQQAVQRVEQARQKPVQSLDARRASELRNAPAPSGESAMKMRDIRREIEQSQQSDDRAELARNIDAARPKPPRTIGFQALDRSLRRRRPESGGLLSGLILAQILEKPRSLNPMKPVSVSVPTQTNEDARSSF